MFRVLYLLNGGGTGCHRRSTQHHGLQGLPGRAPLADALTQAQLADRAGVSRATLLRLENGDGGVSIENLLRILRALGLLDNVPRALDPYETDIGRLRSDEHLPQRVRTRSLTGRGDG